MRKAIRISALLEVTLYFILGAVCLVLGILGPSTKDSVVQSMMNRGVGQEEAELLAMYAIVLFWCVFAACLIAIAQLILVLVFLDRYSLTKGKAILLAVLGIVFSGRVANVLLLIDSLRSR